MRRLTMFVALGATALGCASNRPEPKDVRHKLYVRTGHAQKAPPEGELTPAIECPKLNAAGARITVAELPDGAALVFTTNSDVDDLRRRVRRMADMHDTVQGLVGVRSSERVELPHLVLARATVEDIDGGARLTYATGDEAQLEALRFEAQQHAERMLLGHCPSISVGSR